MLYKTKKTVQQSLMFYFAICVLLFFGFIINFLTCAQSEMAVPSVRIYVGLPTKDDPTPAFVLQNLNDKKTQPPTFVRIERTPTGPGTITIVGARLCAARRCSHSSLTISC